MEYTKQYFDIKGKKAEETVQMLANSTFLRDWCYPNPKDENDKEICDLLVCFDDVIIICQIKDIAYTGNDERFIKKAIEHPIKQLRGAERRLFDSRRPVVLRNQYGFEENFDSSVPKKVFRLVISLGCGDIFVPFMYEEDGILIHIMDRFIEIVMNELDTIADFTKYLIDCEGLYKSRTQIMVNGGEEELLAEYVAHNKSFAHLSSDSFAIFERGGWSELASNPEYKRKQTAVRISYAWDTLIGMLHESGDPRYKQVAKEIARPNRNERRLLAFSFLDAFEQTRDRTRMRRYLQLNGITFVFIFVPHKVDREERKKELGNVCFILRSIFKHNSKVIGIASDILGSPQFSYDCVLLDMPFMTEEQLKTADEMKRKHKVFINSKLRKVHMDEYPTEESKATHGFSFEPEDGIGSSKRKIGRNEQCPCGSGIKFKKCHGNQGQ
jgi:hypothetical protein